MKLYQAEITDKLAIRRITMKGVYEFMVDKHEINTIGTYSNFITYIKKNKLLPKKNSTGHPRYETKETVEAKNLLKPIE